MTPKLPLINADDDFDNKSVLPQIPLLSTVRAKMDNLLIYMHIYLYNLNRTSNYNFQYRQYCKLQCHGKKRLAAIRCLSEHENSFECCIYLYLNTIFRAISNILHYKFQKVNMLNWSLCCKSQTYK